jgi:hypothetical protein
MARILLVSTCLLLGGCIFHNVGSEERLRDAVVELNDQTRWGRMDTAVERVHPQYRREFVRSHRQWASTVHIADVELMQVQIAGSRERATITVALSWYSYETMELRNTVIRQRWRREGAEYFLHSEEVMGGDDSLLPAAEPTRAAAPQSSGS